MQIDEAIQRAWDDWHIDAPADMQGGDATPVFAHGFRVGVARPEQSPTEAWRRYGRGVDAPTPPALIEGVRAGREWMAQG